MLSFLKKFFGAKPAVSPCPEAPYKVEKTTTVGTVPMTTQYAEPVPAEAKPKKKPAAKKPAGEKKPAVRAKATRTKKQAS